MIEENKPVYLQEHTGLVNKVLHEIFIERVRQEALRAQGKFPATCATIGITEHTCLAVLMEEVGEVARALNDSEGTLHLREEVIQCAAVCAAWAERLTEPS